MSKTIGTFLTVFFVSFMAQAGIAKQGYATCKVKGWNAKYYDLSCDPRTPDFKLKTPAEWVKPALAGKTAKTDQVIKVEVTQAQLEAWIDMNKQRFAKLQEAKGSKK